MSFVARPSFSSDAARRIHAAGVAFQQSQLGLKPPARAIAPPVKPAAVPQAQPPKRKPRDEIRHSFVPGESNELALRVAMAAIDEVGVPGPIYIHGPTGVGKTHLLATVGTAAAVAGKGAIDLVVRPGAHFHRAMQTLARAGGQDLYLFDDMQFCPQSLAEAISELEGTKIIVGDRPPHELGFPDRVKSRLAAGLVCSIGLPDIVTRRRIVDSRVDALRLDHPEFAVDAGLADALAERIRRNGRSLVAAVNRLLAGFVLAGAKPTLFSIDHLLTDLIGDVPPRPPTVREIVAKVAEHFHMRPEEILSSRRQREIVRPRHVAMYLAKMLTPRSLPEIGRHLGGRDHTTILHGFRKIEAALMNPAGQPEIAADIAAIRSELAAMPEVRP